MPRRLRLPLLLAWALVCLAGCGGRIVHRPLELFVGGISGRAMTLVVLVFPGGEPACASMSAATAQGADAPIRAEWHRGTDERGLLLDPVDAEQITLAVYTEDADGQVIQFVCQDIEYADLESPSLSIQLRAAG